MARRFVYLIRLEDRFKIGNSIDPHGRLLQVAPGGTLLHSFPSADAFRVENALHRRFAEQRLKQGREREWFRLSPADVGALLRLGRTDAVTALPADLQPPPTPRSKSLSLKRDLHRMASLVATYEGLDLWKFLDNELRPIIEKEWNAIISKGR